jgi:ribonucleoside-diphosphate reductase alpha chain
VEDIKECYRLSWELGLKANALYRDGCKLSQPLSATADEAKKESGQAESKAGPDMEPSSSVKEGVGTEAQPAMGHAETPDAKFEGGEAPIAPHALEAALQMVQRAQRRRLPDTRRSLTHKFNVAGHEGYLTVGLFEDGQPGELFITMSKEGSTIGGLMDSLGTATSIALQYGVPVSSLVSKFSHQRFEPAGMTENRDIPFAKSLVDYIFRWMGMQFVAGYREANSPQRSMVEEPAATTVSAGPIVTGVVAAAATPPGSLLESRMQHAAPRITEVRQEMVSITEVSRTGLGGSAISASGLSPTTAVTAAATLSLAMEAMADAPACDGCGTITVRSGTCYKCMNCGNSMGCS